MIVQLVAVPLFPLARLLLTAFASLLVCLESFQVNLLVPQLVSHFAHIKRQVSHLSVHMKFLATLVPQLQLLPLCVFDFADTRMNGCLVVSMTAQVVNLIESAFVDIPSSVLVEELAA